MQPNKERQRRICRMLHKSLPKGPELDLWEQNQRLSPLLRLPPELRNRIYELVLTVGQINVCFKKWEHRIQSPTTRNGRRPGYETIPGGFGCRILERDQNPWRDAPSKKTTSSATSTTTTSTTTSPQKQHHHHHQQRGMRLLSPVCRQLYHETVLLPFRLNAWSFESVHVMDRYVMKEKRLPLPHRRAIRLLYTQTVLPTAVEKYFGGLEVVVLETGLTMVRRVVEGESTSRQVVAWDVQQRKWK